MTNATVNPLFLYECILEAGTQYNKSLSYLTSKIYRCKICFRFFFVEPFQTIHKMRKEMK